MLESMITQLMHGSTRAFVSHKRTHFTREHITVFLKLQAFMREI
jgi:hypothetical protein